MTEPDVTLTDYALAIECATLCWLVTRWSAADRRQRFWWAVLFGSIGLGSLLGGTVHGFFSDETTAGYTVLWPATLLTLGITSACMWIVGAHALLRDPARVWVSRAAAAFLVVYAIVVIFVSARFVVAIAAYLPAALFLLVVFVSVGRRRGRNDVYGTVGLLLTFVAAVVQQRRVALHPVYFNHNALYHVIQGVAIVLLFLGARQLLESRGPALEGVRAI